MKTARFHYHLPPEAIAQHPAEPRDEARLLDTRDLSDHRFRDLIELLAPEDLLVLNRTRVLPARLQGTKRGSGGAVEVLLLEQIDDRRWRGMVRPARRLRAGTELDLGRLRGRLLDDPVDGEATLDLQADGDVGVALQREGQVPLPPYVRVPLTDPERYQTVYADRPGSAAAPTAGLHFTQPLLRRVEAHGVEIARVELQVGLDTFRPIATKELVDHRIHSERFELTEETAEAVARTSDSGGRIVAVGTTVVRVLETCAAGTGRVRSGSGRTELFITPGYRFQIVDGLLTNFHVPASSLVVLVAAFMGTAWRRSYAHALARGYRFLSFGDAMYAERAR